MCTGLGSKRTQATGGNSNAGYKEGGDKDDVMGWGMDGGYARERDRTSGDGGIGSEVDW